MTYYFEFWTNLPKILTSNWLTVKVSCFLYDFLNFYNSSWLAQKLMLEDPISNCKNYPRTNLPCYAFGGKEYSKPTVEECFQVM